MLQHVLDRERFKLRWLEQLGDSEWTTDSLDKDTANFDQQHGAEGFVDEMPAVAYGIDTAAPLQVSLN